MNESDKTASEEPKIEVSGTGASASSSGVAAGEGGIAVGGNVLGNIVKAVNFITIIGGLEASNQQVLHELGEDIKNRFSESPADPAKLIGWIQSQVELRLDTESTSHLLEIVQVVGKIFSPLVEKYENIIQTDSFPFGDFLRDMIKGVGDTGNLKKCFENFGIEKQGISLQDISAVFVAPSRYMTLALPYIDKALTQDLMRFVPCQAPLYLYQRIDAWSGKELYIGQFYKDGEKEVVCPIYFQGRDILAHKWKKRVNHIFFSAIATGLLADYVMYLYMLELDRNTALNILQLLRKLGK